MEGGSSSSQSRQSQIFPPPQPSQLPSPQSVGPCSEVAASPELPSDFHHQLTERDRESMQSPLLPPPLPPRHPHRHPNCRPFPPQPAILTLTPLTPGSTYEPQSPGSSFRPKHRGVASQSFPANLETVVGSGAAAVSVSAPAPAPVLAPFPVQVPAPAPVLVPAPEVQAGGQTLRAGSLLSEFIIQSWGESVLTVATTYNYQA